MSFCDFVPVLRLFAEQGVDVGRLICPFETWAIAYNLNPLDKLHKLFPGFELRFMMAQNGRRWETRYLLSECDFPGSLLFWPGALFILVPILEHKTCKTCAVIVDDGPQP